MPFERALDQHRQRGRFGGPPGPTGCSRGAITPDGRLVARLPAGPSRTIDLAYRPYNNASSYAAQTEATETVTAGLALTITPGQTRPTGTITLNGHVLGQIPRSGVLVEVLVYYHHCWEPIRTPRTDSHERFTLRYQFQRAYGRFPFALRVSVMCSSSATWRPSSCRGMEPTRLNANHFARLAGGRMAFGKRNSR